MKFLLFFVSTLFSLIFYTFYNLTLWKNLLWKEIQNKVSLDSFSWNLLIESFLFFFIWIIFIYAFSGFNSKKQTKIITNKLEILYFIYYSIFIFYIFFLNSWLNFFSISLILLLIISDILFNHLSNFHRFINFKIIFRYVWLIINYIITFISIYYIYKNWLSFIPFYILFYNIIFNFIVHKKFTNYISLFVSIIACLFLIISFCFFIYDIFITYI